MTLNEKLSRRSFLRLAAASASTFAFNLTLFSPGTTAAEPENGYEITSWMTIDRSNRVTVRIPQGEIGQGITTTLQQVIADELNLEFNQTSWEFYDPLVNYQRNNVYIHTSTLGSIGMKMLYQPMQNAGAQVRTLLMQAAATRLGSELSHLRLENHHLVDMKKSMSIGFGELVQNAASQMIPADSQIIEHPNRNRNFVGQRLSRVDANDKSTGKAQYGIDIQLPDMKYAAIKQSPVFGGKLKSFDEQAIANSPGFQKIVSIKAGPSGYTVPNFFHEVIDWGMDDAVAVISDSWWHAQQALNALPIEWLEGENQGVDSGDIDKRLMQKISDPGDIIRQEGDIEQGFREADEIVEATYYYPFLEHAPLEPMNCTALFQEESLEVWAPTQYGDEALRIAAYAAGLPPYRVKLHLTLAGGGFGRRLHSDFVSQAVQIAKQMPGVPIKLISSREESIRRSYYSPVMAAKFKGGLNADGELTTWESHVCQGNSVYQPYGLSRMVYSVPNTKISYSEIPTPPPFAWMRGVGHTQSFWMYHSFIGEIAKKRGIDHLSLQRQMLDVSSISPHDYQSFYGLGSNQKDTAARITRFNERLDDVVKRSKSVFSEKDTSKHGFAVYDMSYAAGVSASTIAIGVEVSINPEKMLKIENAIASVDCGLAVNPEIVESQIAGGMIFGISNALHGEITLKDGQIEQSNFHDYPVLKLKDSPNIRVYIADSSDKTPNGIGEGAVPVVIAALVDAIANAGGPRIRKLPILDRNGRIKA